ncbi:MAG: NAD(+) synthase [Candidatus Krumholzibacteria bacterium]|nr:NAD(+) synthase [Candidatus Krumholzibacteria bacterium]
MAALTELRIDFDREAERISSFISEFVDIIGSRGIALGLSGGLDSSVTAGLCVRALSPDRVKALLLPERDSSADSVEDARIHAEKLGIEYRVVDLTSALNELGCYESRASDLVRFRGGARAAVRLFPGLARKGYLANLRGGGGKQFQDFIAFTRIKHRLRMVAVYQEAEKSNLSVASCVNRTEYETGFYVHYGDDAGDIAPIKHLYKTQVFGMGKFLGIPVRILEKKPSPDLFAGMKDEEIMGISYGDLDGALWCISHGLSDKEIELKLGLSINVISYVKEIGEQSGRLREAPASLME